MKDLRVFSPCLIGLLAGLVSLSAVSYAQDSAPRYKDPKLSIKDRVADLLPRMTLDEKIEQISGGWESRVNVIDPTGTFTSEVLLTEMSSGSPSETPLTRSFLAGPEWKQYSFPFSDFGTDGSNIAGILFGLSMQPDKFAFEINQVELNRGR